MVADNGDGRRFQRARREVDEVVGEQGEDVVAFRNWQKGEQWRDIEEGRHGANLDWGSGGAGGAAVILRAATHGDGFDFETVWRWKGGATCMEC